MKKILTLASALVVLGASTAMAQGALNLYWNNCSVGGATTAAFACNVNTGLAFVMNASVFPAHSYATFASASAVIDIQVDGGALPAWWSTNTGQCRANQVAITFDPTTNLSNCVDIWAFSTIVQVSAIQQGVNGPDRVRVNGLAAIPAGSEVALAADGTEYWLAKVSIFRANTLTCPGCNLGACIVFNESKLLSPTEPQQTIITPGANNSITWNGGTPNCPGATPAQNRTWGAVKNLYR